MWLQKDIMPILGRVIFFLIGAAFVYFAYSSIHTGRIGVGKTATHFWITKSQEPVPFWILVFVHLGIAAVMFYGAFTKRKPDA